MSKRKATHEAVSGAIQTLIEQGSEPTADRIVAISGGSKSTVIDSMKALTASRQTPARALPERIEAAVREAVHSVWTQATELADKDINLVKSEAQEAVVKIQEQVDSERKVVRQLNKNLEDKDKQLEELRFKVAKQSVEVDQTEMMKKQIDALILEISNERIKSTEYQILAAEIRGELKAFKAGTNSTKRLRS